MTKKLELLQKQLHDLKKNLKYIKKGERDKVKLQPVRDEGSEPLTSEERAKISHLTKQIPGEDAARKRVASWEEKIKKQEFNMKDKSDNKEVKRTQPLLCVLCFGFHLIIIIKLLGTLACNEMTWHAFLVPT